MKLYTTKKDVAATPSVVADDMILTVDMPTAAGSKMLDGYMSLFEAEALTRLTDSGYAVVGKADVGEFAVDLVGETSYNGAVVSDGKLANASAEIVKSGDATVALCLDVNGSVRRAAAQSGLIGVKPTYGTVSRYGVIPAACSGDTVSVMAKTVADVQNALDAIAGHDDKDGTSLSDEQCALIKKGGNAKAATRVAILGSMTEKIDADVKAILDARRATLAANGIEVVDVDGDIFATARPAWNILMSAELCNNVSRYDGIKYGYRSENFTNIDELYTNSRTEAFGELLKSRILFGSDTLSTENYMKVYDKALRVRRVVVDAFAKLFADFDAVMIPAASKTAYTEDDVRANKFISYEENLYTAPASIAGLPTVVAGGVQLIGKAFSENTLFGLATLFEKEGK